ncbi:thioredoxin [Cuniculiplasma sp. SKW3]|uniref:thioredoxin n=1 Tax=unclassified Cuniculiplasma TaxID=2619706 RepID=UPI003FD3F5E7
MDDDAELERIRKQMMARIQNESVKKEVKNMKPIELTDSTFADAVKKEKILVVDFWASWCAPCRFLSPIIEELAKDYAGKITFGKVDVDANPRVSASFNISSIPTVMMFKDGKVADVSIGAVPKQMLETKLKRLMN